MAAHFFTQSLVIQILFCLISLVLGLLWSESFLMQMSIGLWPILFADIVVQCNKDPEVSRGLCCLPIQIKSKYYPWVLILIFTIFFGLQLSLWVGFLVGYLTVFNLMKWSEISVVRAKTWEKKFPFQKFNQHPAFVSSDQAFSGSLPQFVQRNVINGPPRDNNGLAQQPQSNSQFSAFQGRGVSLGGEGSGPSPMSFLNRSASNNNTANSTASNTQSRNLAGQSKLVSGGASAGPNESI